MSAEEMLEKGTMGEKVVVLVIWIPVLSGRNISSELYITAEGKQSPWGAALIILFKPSCNNICLEKNVKEWHSCGTKSSLGVCWLGSMAVTVGSQQPVTWPRGATAVSCKIWEFKPEPNAVILLVLKLWPKHMVAILMEKPVFCLSPTMEGLSTPVRLKAARMDTSGAAPLPTSSRTGDTPSVPSRMVSS